MNLAIRRLRMGLVAAACGLSTSFAHAQQAQPQIPMDEIMKAMGAMMTAATNTGSAAVADFRELKALLPADLPGFKRTSANGERTGAMGMKVSYAEATYEDGQGASLDIKITDISGAGPMAKMAHAGWASAEVDRESDAGYERTTVIAGQKAMEQYTTADRSGSVQVLVDGRFTVEISGYGIEAEQLRAALARVDLKKLAAIQPPAPAAP